MAQKKVRSAFFDVHKVLAQLVQEKTMQQIGLSGCSTPKANAWLQASHTESGKTAIRAGSLSKVAASAEGKALRRGKARHQHRVLSAAQASSMAPKQAPQQFLAKRPTQHGSNVCSNIRRLSAKENSTRLARLGIHFDLFLVANRQTGASSTVSH
jgi:hypothetical protein